MLGLPARVKECATTSAQAKSVPQTPDDYVKNMINSFRSERRQAVGFFGQTIATHFACDVVGDQ